MFSTGNGSTRLLKLWSLTAGMAIGLSLASSAEAATLISTCGPVSQDVQLAADLVTTGYTCLDVRADGVTIDGAGHSITAGTLAVSILDHSNVTVKRIATNQPVQIYGENA